MYHLTLFVCRRCLWEFGDTLLLLLCPLDIDHPLLIALDIFVAWFPFYDTKCRVCVSAAGIVDEKVEQQTVTGQQTTHRPLITPQRFENEYYLPTNKTRQDQWKCHRR